MKKKKSFVISLLTIICLLVLSACGNSSASSNNNGSKKAEKLALKLGHQAPEDSQYHRYALKFKELVEERTNGKVEIEIYPFRQLGGDRELLEAMQLGNLDLGVISGPPVSGFTPEMAVLDLPFIFEDWKHVKKFLASDIYKEIMALTDKNDLKTLSMAARGFRHVTNSKKPIETSGDFKGLKLRVIESPAYIKAYQQLGANVQSMAWGDTMTALQQGALDAQENTIDIIHDEKVYEVQKYVSMTGVTFCFVNLMASKQHYEKWPEDIRKIMDEAALEAAEYITEKNEKLEEDYRNKLEEKGMEFNEVDISEFNKGMEVVYESYTKQYGDELVKKIQELNK
ncbi:TRAP transporter substrate-binding protein [Bacillus alveayuensis]|uniref:TRAP transporter substrate-binding protein n=1 Tax=Aeribacillus alveayuensis TaxID=279215 RepID=UPI0005CCB552|nr:TRAP transporter substrate-binding protein [Bacillus alveayuensis]